MFRSKTCAALVLTLALGATPALAQQPEHEQHHPGAAAGAAQQGGAEGTTSGSGGMPRMGMMGQAMMGQGMCQGMMGSGMRRMGMMSERADHVEGRIAFLKAELEITDAQLSLWNAVADAMRDNAKNAQAVRGGMRGMMDQPSTLPDRLAAREKALASQLESTRKLKAAVYPLYAALNDEQKKTADALTGGHRGMMGGGMMGGGMMRGGMPGGTPDQGGEMQDRHRGRMGGGRQN